MCSLIPKMVQIFRICKRQLFAMLNKYLQPSSSQKWLVYKGICGLSPWVTKKWPILVVCNTWHVNHQKDWISLHNNSVNVEVFAGRHTHDTDEDRLKLFRWKEIEWFGICHQALQTACFVKEDFGIFRLLALAGSAETDIVFTDICC